MSVLLRWTMVISAMPEGEVVTVPRSRIQRAPKSLLMMESRGMSVGGVDAARAKGVMDFISSEDGSQSKMLRTVLRVPPLAPEVLNSHRKEEQNRALQEKTYFISLIQQSISFVWEASSSRTCLTSAQASISAGALSTPTEGMIYL